MFSLGAGEALSFYLSRLLGLDAVPAVTLVHVNASAGQWLGVNVTGAGWQDGRTVALIQWIHGLDSERSVAIQNLSLHLIHETFCPDKSMHCGSPPLLSMGARSICTRVPHTTSHHFLNNL